MTSLLLSNLATCENVCYCYIGNPGLDVPLTLADFSSSAQPPAWMSAERWESVMVLSLLRGSMDGLCARMVGEDEQAWRDWYSAPCPETLSLPLPLAPAATDTADEQQADNAGNYLVNTSYRTYIG